MFDDNIAFELAYRKVEEQLLSKSESKSKYRDEVLNGGNIEISVHKAQTGTINDGSEPAKKSGQSAAIRHKDGNTMQTESKDAALDETFMTAKTNLMDRSDFSLDGTINRANATTNEMKPKIPAIIERPNDMKNTPKEKKPETVPYTKSKYQPQYAKKPLASNTKPVEQPPKQQPQYAKKPLATDTKPVEHPPKQQQQPSNPVADSTPQLKSQSLKQQRPKEAPSTAPPVMTGKDRKTEKETPKKAPASSGTPKKAPGSGTFGGMKSWLIKKLNPDAKQCHLPENEEQPYFDKELKRWVFPGDDPAELAKPMAPPPTVIKKEDEVKKEEPKDAISSLMAPPPSRLSARKKPMGGAPPGGGMMPPMMGGMMMPPGAAPAGMMSPMGAAPDGAAGAPKFAMFTPKPAVFTPKAAAETPLEKEDVPTDDEPTTGA
eukprot:jgi/Psemu1/308430/fgenesh1_kg.411_\